MILRTKKCFKINEFCLQCPEKIWILRCVFFSFDIFQSHYFKAFYSKSAKSVTILFNQYCELCDDVVVHRFCYVSLTKRNSQLILNEMKLKTEEFVVKTIQVLSKELKTAILREIEYHLDILYEVTTTSSFYELENAFFNKFSFFAYLSRPKALMPYLRL